MMPFPTASLPHRVTVEPYLGPTGNGERSYGAAMTYRGSTAIPARIVKRRSVLRGADNSTTVCTVQIDMRPDLGALADETRITHGTKVYYVQACDEAVDLRRIEGYRYSCTGPEGSA